MSASTLTSPLPPSPSSRALASRTGEALALLRLLAANNLGRLAARLDDASRRYLADLVGGGWGGGGEEGVGMGRLAARLDDASRRYLADLV